MQNPLRSSSPALARLRGGSARPARIALYSHDTQGLGHVRRNLLIARALTGREERPTILLLSGVHEAAAFDLPPGVDCLTLPGLGKDILGRYAPRSLGVSMHDLVELRARTISAAVRSFRPDVLVVDKVPRGAFDELLPTLQAVRSHGRTRTVLGLREILDDPAAVRAEWARTNFLRVVRHSYDRIWIYGDPAVFDAADAYGLPADLRQMTRYTGYLTAADPDASPAEATASTDGPREVLCVVGGGQDGLPLAEAFAGAPLPSGWRGRLITGPRMPTEAVTRLRRRAADGGRLEVAAFVTDPVPFMRRADRIVAMGGYNTMCEVVSVGKPALIVPRVEPRTEQLIRAERFAALGLVDVLHPRELSATALASWMARPASRRPPASKVVDLGGAARLPELLTELLESAQREGPIHAAG